MCTDPISALRARTAATGITDADFYLALCGVAIATGTSEEQVARNIMARATTTIPTTQEGSDEAV